MTEFKPPSWAGPPEPGLHLDVMKDGTLVGKYAVDGKTYYLFGRNPEATDFAIDHVSCSRVHAALVHHKALKRPFLLDLGSTHGTFVGNIRLESNKPQQLFPDSSFHFGASTRQYYLREKNKPKAESFEADSGNKKSRRDITLPASDHELETLTSYNTEQNCRLSELKVQEHPKAPILKRKHVSFIDEEDIINPEDCDPNVGRFQNLVATEVIPSAKRPKLQARSSGSSSVHRIAPPLGTSKGLDLYDDLPTTSVHLPNSAPDVESQPIDVEPHTVSEHESAHHKKYAKEVWPGKASNTPHGVV